MPISSETLAGRRARILEELGDGVMVLPASPRRVRSRDTAFRYRPDSELFYATGVTEPEAVAVLRPRAVDAPFVLFVRPRDPESEMWEGRRGGPEAVGERIGADACYSTPELPTRLPEMLDGAGSISFRLNVHAGLDRLVLESLARARAKGARSGTGPRSVHDPGSILDDMRLIKDEEELQLVRRAAALTAEAHRDTVARVGPGMGEWEVEALLESGFRARGADGPAFETIVGSGKNGCVLHYVANSAVLAADELVLLDGGAAASLYAGDVTRTFPVAGRFTPEQAAVYEVVKGAHSAALSAIRPGMTIGEVHEEAVRVLVEGLVDLDILSGDREELIAEAAHREFFPHQTSHWLGLDVHDVGDYTKEGSSRALVPGMVLTVEPGLYFRGESDDSAPFQGIGVRIEDDVLVTRDGQEVLSNAVTSDAEELSALVGSALG